jgi:DNA replication and repair protein RecF
MRGDVTSDLAPGDCPRIARLTLRDFRSYASLDLSTDAPLVALVGENGAGKTNLLEALSLFTPGRGLRRADLADMVRHGASRATVSVRLADERRLGVALGPDETGTRTARTSRIDGAPASSTAAFAEHLRIVWLTPDLDGLFRGSPGERRRFLDRLVLAVDPRHAARVSSLDRALRSRNRLLQDATPAPAWLDAIERELAELAVVVGSARRETVERLDAEMLAARDEASPFPHARLALEGAFDALVATLPAVDVEDRFLEELRVNRRRDAAAGRTLAGPQVSDLAVRHGPKDLPGRDLLHRRAEGPAARTCHRPCAPCPHDERHRAFGSLRRDRRPSRPPPPRGALRRTRQPWRTGLDDGCRPAPV